MREATFYTPAVTAMNADGTLDAAANLALWEHLLAGGVDGIVLLGSAGEFPSLTLDEKRSLIDLAARHLQGRTELIVGTATMRVDETIALSNHALAQGADAVMVVGPWYFGLDESAVEAYFSAVADGVDGPLYLYNFPDRTGWDLSSAVTLRLLRNHANIVGYKDTLMEADHTRRLIAAVRDEFPGFRVLAGYDELLHRTVTTGGAGAIGGISNVYPEICAAYARAVRDGDPDRIEATQRVIDIAMGFYEIGTPFIPIIKKALGLRGLPVTEHSVAPIQPATEAQTAAISALMATIEAAAGRAGIDVAATMSRTATS